MSKLVLDNLQKQKEELCDQYQVLETRKDDSTVELLGVAMKGFKVPEGFSVLKVKHEISLKKIGETWGCARVNIDKERNFETFKREIKVSVNANGGYDVDSLLAQAEFVKFVSPKLDEIKKMIQDVEDSFEPEMTTILRDIREVDKAISDVKNAEYQLKVDEIFRQMKSEDGYDAVVTKSHWGGVDYARLQLKYNYSADVTRVKIVTESLSGKSAHIEYDYKLYDGTVVTRGEDNVRMDNLKSFVRQQLFRVEKIEEGELEVAE